jgi:hypothetical protein
LRIALLNLHAAAEVSHYRPPLSFFLSLVILSSCNLAILKTYPKFIFIPQALLVKLVSFKEVIGRDTGLIF